MTKARSALTSTFFLLAFLIWVFIYPLASAGQFPTGSLVLPFAIVVALSFLWFVARESGKDQG